MTTLKDTRVLLTGASRGLGAELAVGLARRGAKLVLVARDGAELERVRSRILAEGGSAVAIVADVADKEAVHRIAALASAAFALAGAPGGVDVLVHNAGALGPSPLELMLDTDCEDVERAFAVNVLGPFRLTKAVLGHMVVRKRGLVVAVSSDAAVNAYPSWGAYGATKAALEHTMRTFAVENEASGVRFLVVDPGEMDTRMHAEALPGADRATLTPPRVAAERLARAMEVAMGGRGAGDFSRVELGGAS
jgi:NAD(P)-dependent dehydrogenase (short-subunit alcohol dehydrogenase family)